MLEDVADIDLMEICCQAGFTTPKSPKSLKEVINDCKYINQKPNCIVGIFNNPMMSFSFFDTCVVVDSMALYFPLQVLTNFKIC
jgi:hypothetical protein